MPGKFEGPQSFQPVDPVCGQRIEASAETFTTEYKKRTYYFCSPECQHAFEKQTERFRLEELARAGALFMPQAVRWGLA